MNPPRGRPPALFVRVMLLSTVYGALSGCAQAPPKLTAADIPYGEGTVQGALDALRTPAPAASADDTPEQRAITRLEERVGQLELLLTEMKVQGVMPATAVTYDPRLGTMAATNTQVALETLEARLARLEDAASGAAMGQPGPGLFDVGKGNKGGKAGARSGPNSPGGPGGPPTPPTAPPGGQKGAPGAPSGGGAPPAH